MPTTTNFGWTTPADTDLVKDGASAIRTLGNGIDTSLVDLKGGTTGQVLSKASNTDMDFSWVAQDDSNAIQNALLTTTGDTIYASAASTPARLGLGTAGQVLTVNSGATAPEWATPATPSALTLLSTTSLSGSATTISNISQAYNYLFIYINNVSGTSDAEFTADINGSSTNANTIRIRSASATAVATRNTRLRPLGSDNIGNTTTTSSGNLQIFNYTSTTGFKQTSSVACIYSANAAAEDVVFEAGGIETTSAITSITFNISAGTFDSGTILIYGVK